MRFVNMSLAMIATLTLVACGERIPPEVQMKTDHYVGTWVNESELKANAEAADGGTGTIRVINITSNLEILEETRTPGQATPPEGIVVGKLFAKVGGSAELRYNVAQLKEEKVSRLTDEEITRLGSAPLGFKVSVDRKSATLTKPAVGIHTENVIKLVKIDGAQRTKLKLNETVKRAGTATPAPAPGPKPPLPDQRMMRK